MSNKQSVFTFDVMEAGKTGKRKDLRGFDKGPKCNREKTGPELVECSRYDSYKKVFNWFANLVRI